MVWTSVPTRPKLSNRKTKCIFTKLGQKQLWSLGRVLQTLSMIQNEVMQFLFIKVHIKSCLVVQPLLSNSQPLLTKPDIPDKYLIKEDCYFKTWISYILLHLRTWIETEGYIFSKPLILLSHVVHSVGGKGRYTLERWLVHHTANTISDKQACLLPQTFYNRILYVSNNPNKDQTVPSPSAPIILTGLVLTFQQKRWSFKA